MTIKLSASLIKDWLACKAMPFNRINFPEEVVPSREMHIGNAVHFSIEHGWTNMESSMVYLEKYRKYFDYTPQEKDFILKCLNNFHSVFRGFLSEEDLVEKKFSIDIGNDVRVVGKIDRITSDGKIFDWKTDRKVPSSISKSPQFIIYDWAYRKLFDKQPVGVYFASLTEGSLISKKKDALSENELFESIIPAIVSDIRNNKFPRTGLFTGTCFRCQYKKSCLKED
jgi:hypothetical protein